MELSLQNHPCHCPPGQCAAFVEPDTDCINRRRGVVVTAPCVECSPQGGYTWHENGECLKCKRIAREETFILGLATGDLNQVACKLINDTHAEET